MKVEVCTCCGFAIENVLHSIRNDHSLLDSSGSGGGLAGSLGGELLTGSLSSGGFTCGLLGSGHFEVVGRRVWFVRRQGKRWSIV